LSQQEDSSLFVDVDHSTKTSSRQLKFLGEDRIESLSLIDRRDVLVRDLFIGYIESLDGAPFEQVYMDFGAPESEQFPALVGRDLDFKAWSDILENEVIFHVISAGGGAYRACVEYLDKIIQVVSGRFRIIVWHNIGTFHQFPQLAKELSDNCELFGLELREFGDFNADTLIGKMILDGIRNGNSLDQYPPGARIRLQAELKNNFSHERS
ncbi:MAG TPA: hypothetical protein VGN64_21845, partial [Dyadobacter sp.]|nr:hypothetical protein [Dyadobacter sp.]